jgi:two-component system, chemotaxis family, chemotaxis protein CheY
MARTVLIVDDSNTVVQQLTKALSETSDFKVIGRAATAEEAVLKYQELKPDLVTMDMVMPGGDAVDAIRQIVALDAQAKVVVVSSIGGAKDTVVSALSAGAKNVIVKPIEKERVLQVLRALI